MPGYRGFYGSLVSILLNGPGPSFWGTKTSFWTNDIFFSSRNPFLLFQNSPSLPSTSIYSLVPQLKPLTSFLSSSPMLLRKGHNRYFRKQDPHDFNVPPSESRWVWFERTPAHKAFLESGIWWFLLTQSLKQKIKNRGRLQSPFYLAPQGIQSGVIKAQGLR